MCQYFKENVGINNKFIAENLEKSKTDSYWHMVGLFYNQMDGITEGFLMKSDEDNLDYEDFDIEIGTRFINFLPDFFDYVEKYKLEVGVEGEGVERKARPSCSVLIKHLPDQGEVYVGHNTWHEYRAMGYRLVIICYSVLCTLYYLGY